MKPSVGEQQQLNEKYCGVYKVPGVTGPENESVLLHFDVSLKPENKTRRKLTSETETPVRKM